MRVDISPSPFVVSLSLLLLSSDLSSLGSWACPYSTTNQQNLGKRIPLPCHLPPFITLITYLLLLPLLCLVLTIRVDLSTCVILSFLSLFLFFASIIFLSVTSVSFVRQIWFWDFSPQGLVYHFFSFFTFYLQLPFNPSRLHFSQLASPACLFFVWPLFAVDVQVIWTEGESVCVGKPHTIPQHHIWTLSKSRRSQPTPVQTRQGAASQPQYKQDKTQ